MKSFFLEWWISKRYLKPKGKERFFSIITLLFFVILLWMSTSKRNYVALHLIIKFLIVTGVASLSLIDYSIIIEKLLLK